MQHAYKKVWAGMVPCLMIYKDRTNILLESLRAWIYRRRMIW
jgi:hypothetical protein